MGVSLKVSLNSIVLSYCSEPFFATVTCHVEDHFYQHQHLFMSMELRRGICHDNDLWRSS